MKGGLHKVSGEPAAGLAVITGSARRIGKAMAEHLAAKGWNIALHYNNSEQPARDLADLLQQKYGEQKFMTFEADLSKASGAENLIPAIISGMGSPTLLVNNASVFEPAPIISTTADFLDLHFNINFKAPFLLTRSFAHYVGGGLIINMIDTRINTNHDNFAAYTLSKKVLWELTKMAAATFGPAIRVNAIAPGLTLPPDGRDEDYLRALSNKTAMKRPGGIVPVLQSLDFILDNTYLTGQLLYCDGGENLGVLP